VQSQVLFNKRPSYSQKKMHHFDMRSYIPLYPLSGGFAYSNFSYITFFEIYRYYRYLLTNRKEHSMSDTMTYVDYRTLARKTAEEGLIKSLTAPQKSGWSQLAGTKIPSKNDVMRATNSNVRAICNMAKELFPDKPLLITEEEDVNPVAVK